ncbi:phenylacetate--CoA ligase family protein [Pontimicrobium sp. SW4]|uniref:Phenylacetate--CoA ligase family protein n=1 Tax=Pontimicrobium sp. SW4 TaxID=3153519 RepID=A0AAU7BSC1_9FLAO
MNLFNLSLRCNRFPISKAERALKEIQEKSESEFETFITQKKKDIVSYHIKHTSFYKSLAKNVNLLDWDTIPVMTKRDLQQPLKDRLSENYTVKNVYVNKTSGSSGDPFVFAKDKFCHAMTWAIFKEWYGWYSIFHTKQARFYGIPLDKKGYYKERFKDWVTNRYRFNVFDLSETALDNWVKKFKKTDFVFMTGYTSVIVAFAKRLLQRNLILSEICPTLKACLPTSEMLSEEDKKLLEKAFNIPIINEYGSAEFGLIALEKDEQWVLNNLNLYVEILDNQGNILPYGEEGRIVITDLFNKAHPFIRYEIGDIGSINTVDKKTSVLKTLTGRKEDYVKLPSGKTAPGLSFYYVTKSVMKDDGSIQEIKVLQHALNRFEIEYVSENALNDDQKKRINEALAKYLESGVDVFFTKKSHLERTKKGKLKQFTSLLNPKL